jgi:epsilon-lactone hydrolase
MSNTENATSSFEVTPEGTITVPSFDLPLSAALSPQAASQLAATFNRTGGIDVAALDRLETEEQYKAAVDMFRAAVDQSFAIPLAERILAQFPVHRRPDEIGGVRVEEFTPIGEQDPDHVLINLHGGAFHSGATHVARVESIPVAHLGRYRVVSVDYRQGYEHKFPAASEDVVAVYTELLKSYPAENIGIYGGSAGGCLSLHAAAWMLDKGIPVPGAIGVLGSGSSGRGDGDYFSAIGTVQKPPITAFAFHGDKFGYFSDVSFGNRLVDPVVGGKEFLAKFPPSLFITGTRAFDLSPALATHRALFQAGAETELHVFDGHAHCFYYNTAIPESLDAYDTLLRFLRKHLGK